MLQHYLKKEKKSGCFSLDQIGGQAADEIMNAVALKKKEKKKDWHGECASYELDL